MLFRSPVDKEGFIGKRIAKQDPSKVNLYGDVCSIEWDKKKSRCVWVVKWGGERNLGCHGVSEMNNYYQYYLSLPAEEDPEYQPQKDKRGGNRRGSTTSRSSPTKTKGQRGKSNKKKRKGGPGTFLFILFFFILFSL